MSIHPRRPLVNGVNGSAHHREEVDEVEKLNDELEKQVNQVNHALFHGDALIGDKIRPSGFIANLNNSLHDISRVFTFQNAPDLARVFAKLIAGGGLDLKAGAKLVASLANDSNLRAKFIEAQVKTKYERMLHPPLTYLGDAFKYRTADGKFNSALNPHLGQAGAPYAKTVPSKTHPLGALPPAADIFDRLMARDAPRSSTSGLSSMLIYHATIIIHDIFRTNDGDKNISDTSSYLDLSPLYGYTEKMQREVRDGNYKLGLLKPDTFAEDRLLRQPPGVCIMLVMYNRYHNYAATQLRRINENGRFSVPSAYHGSQLKAAANHFVDIEVRKTQAFKKTVKEHEEAWQAYRADEGAREAPKKPEKPEKPKQKEKNTVKSKKAAEVYEKQLKDYTEACESYEKSSGSAESKAIVDTYEAAQKKLQAYLANEDSVDIKEFNDNYDKAWNKLDDDLFNTARLITCGMYIQISIHDYLRALMGFHQWNTNFTLDPRVAMTEHRNVSRGLGNQVTVEFNLLYRFHCAISTDDEEYTKELMAEMFKRTNGSTSTDKVDEMPLPEFLSRMGQIQKPETPPWKQVFGISSNEKKAFKRDPITGLFDDAQMAEALKHAMDDPISSFGPKNVPKVMKNIEILGIMQARKWEIGTLNDFRDFFGLKRHETFESISSNIDIQDALRDLYEHPDKVELYPGVFCESDKDMNADPGPSDLDSALWAAIFSDAITLVRSDRFYTVDWNTNSLTSWGMKEVTEDGDVLKGSVFHRLIQRAFPGWFPYDSLRFFHPFYTGERNAEFAREQGKVKDFNLKFEPIKPHPSSGPKKDDPFKYHFDNSNPKQPIKPILLTISEDIQNFLDNQSGDFVHPARMHRQGLPQKMQDVLDPANKGTKAKGDTDGLIGDPKLLIDYFINLTRDIVKREYITMDKVKPTYQIDVTKDLAIPVTTRYIVDFLGVGDLVRSDTNSHAQYSENEIYQHITNCQQFWSYNADETKLLKRRNAFIASMTFLFQLTEKGNVLEASRYTSTRWVRGIFARSKPNAIAALGLRVAQSIYAQEGDFGKATAIFLLIALDTAYQNVLSFTSALNTMVASMYFVAEKDPDLEEPKAVKRAQVSSSHWLQIQKLAFKNDRESFEKIKYIVLEERRTSVKLPIIKVALKESEVKKTVKNGGKKIETSVGVLKDQLVICDIWSAQAEGPVSEEKDLSFHTSFISKYTDYNPKHVAILALTATMKVVGQLKNLRAAHESQGMLKRVNLNATTEDYSNYMAPMRLAKIKRDIAREASSFKTQNKPTNVPVKVYQMEVSRPETHTYLTPEWDEMIPFPTTWKLRFDGYGASNYKKNFGKLLQAPLPDNIAPFYQPNGPSHTGGSFGDTVCTFNTALAKCNQDTTKDSKDESKGQEAFRNSVPPAATSGCGMAF